MVTHARTASQLIRDSRMYLSRKLCISLAPPDRVSLNVTLRCNLKCTMCTTCYDAPELSLDEIKGIIDQTAAWGVEVFNPLGGEPFMRGDIEEILAYAVRRGFYVTVTTNGTLITDKRARAIAAIPSDRLHFNISLDGDEPVHDRIRGAGTWRRAIAGYRRIREADARAGNARRKILANTILHRHNLGHFEAILDQQAALGFDGVQVLNLFRQSQDPAEIPREAVDLWFRPADLPALEALAERLARRAEREDGHGFHLENTPEELRFIPRYYQEELGPLEAPCWAGWKELYINADGKAIMCDGKLDFLAGTFGDARRQTLRQIWRAPALWERRRVVKKCTTPCIQKCYLRPESDSARDIARDAVRLLGRRAWDRLRVGLPRACHRPDAVLRLELTDVCDCDWEGCSTPRSRWDVLVRGAPERPSAANWQLFRDRGYIDFGRGFMGFDVVRSVIDDLRSARLRFGLLDVRWRGEPLLHPEIEPILDYLLGQAGRAFDRLRVWTSGRFLTPALAAMAKRDAPQDWVIDLDRGDGAGLDLVAGPRTRLLATAAAVPGLDARAILARLPGFLPAAGRYPHQGTRVLWIRRTDHDHYLANARAREALAMAADALGVEAELGEENRPRRCVAPERAPTVSWDGKVTLCPADLQLDNRVGQVTGGPRLSRVWAGPQVEAARRACRTGRGVPDRARCRDCAWPWSPNLP